ncbi:phosphatidate cytidylyltransferase [Alicyclobacillus tolerans]|uniref:phosphatidate cytidylyltransferase n=1 Tax=Alicyclobacillus tolerans TaxID=90970 RepID=UPI001F373C1D|nr:phosphatidate cytidylyltransferase [Alicyclobacillus tolerans]MCF8564784.1 phosphatidate cytidylyltransferase [Alicyclobacillus tolerans]
MLKQRFVTAVLGVFVVIGAMFAGQLPWRLLIGISTLAAVAEFSAMLGFGLKSLLAWWGFAVVFWVEMDEGWHSPLFFQVAVGVTLLLPVLLRNRVTLMQSGAVLVGALYIGYGGVGLIALRNLPNGRAWLLLFLVSIWFTDTFAYFIGRKVQGPKLWPSISPKKTISGSLGGMAGGALGALIVGLAFLGPGASFGYVVLGLTISVLGQVGDLVESAYKRSAGVKDSGHLLPGHGGMLDRVDSLLFAAPFTFYIVAAGLSGWLR